MWEFLRQGFDYDLWANRHWLPYLQDEVDRSIMGHVLAAQQIWVERVAGYSPAVMPSVEIRDEVMVQLHDRWLSVLDGEDREIAFRRTTGEEHTRTVSQIARHVVNHGTYHRGELRGLCRARGSESFEDTDMSRFFGESHEE